MVEDYTNEYQENVISSSLKNFNIKALIAFGLGILLILYLYARENNDFNFTTSLLIVSGIVILLMILKSRYEDRKILPEWKTREILEKELKRYKSEPSTKWDVWGDYFKVGQVKRDRDAEGSVIGRIYEVNGYKEGIPFPHIAYIDLYGNIQSIIKTVFKTEPDRPIRIVGSDFQDAKFLRDYVKGKKSGD